MPIKFPQKYHSMFIDTSGSGFPILTEMPVNQRLALYNLVQEQTIKDGFDPYYNKLKTLCNPPGNSAITPETAGKLQQETLAALRAHFIPTLTESHGFSLIEAAKRLVQTTEAATQANKHYAPEIAAFWGAEKDKVAILLMHAAGTDAKTFREIANLLFQAQPEFGSRENEGKVYTAFKEHLEKLKEISNATKEKCLERVSELTKEVNEQAEAALKQLLPTGERQATSSVIEICIHPPL